MGPTGAHLEGIALDAQGLLSLRLFYLPDRVTPAQLQSAYLALGILNAPSTDIPCHFISSTAEDDWDYAICTLSNVVDE